MTNTTTNAIEINNVVVERNDHRVLNSISFAVPEGSCTMLVGPNGCGKTTLIRAIAGLTRFDGSIDLFGTPLNKLNTRSQARTRAYAPQEPIHPEHMLVQEFVELGNEARVTTAIDDALERCNLKTFRNRKLGSLSGGEKRRASLAQTLAQQTPLVLLDEPTTALDIGHQQSLLGLIDEIRRDLGTTFVVAMHDLTLAGQYSSHIAFMNEGALVDFGSPADVLRIESLEHHYQTTLTVLTDETTRAIVPKRTGL